MQLTSSSSFGTNWSLASKMSTNSSGSSSRTSWLRQSCKSLFCFFIFTSMILLTLSSVLDLNFFTTGPLLFSSFDLQKWNNVFIYSQLFDRFTVNESFYLYCIATNIVFVQLYQFESLFSFNIGYLIHPNMSKSK